ncbi:MAG: 50S ribosomal protein L30 [Chloroflexi bacterium]|nr:MAG: 50S ribosomal protein L30 [Chloroflexota bacterium]
MSSRWWASAWRRPTGPALPPHAVRRWRRQSPEGPRVPDKTPRGSSPRGGEVAAQPAGGAARTVKATLMKSAIGARPEIKATVESLGFRRMNQTRELPDNPAVRGMLRRVNFLVAVEGEPWERPKRSQYKIWRARSNKKHQRGH